MEYKAFKELKSDLITGLRQAKGTLAAKLYSKGLISDDINRSNNNDPSIESILQAVEDRIKVDQSAYTIFLEVLKDMPSVDYFVEKLEQTRKQKELEEESHQKSVLFDDVSFIAPSNETSPAMSPGACRATSQQQGPPISPEYETNSFKEQTSYTNNGLYMLREDAEDT